MNSMIKPRRRAKQKRVSRSRGGNFTVFLFLSLMSLFMALPLVYTVVSAFKLASELFLFPPRFFVQNPTMENFTTMARLAGDMWVPFERYLFNSVFISAVGTVGYILIASLSSTSLWSGPSCFGARSRRSPSTSSSPPWD